MATEDTEGTETNDDGEFTAEDAEGRRETRNSHRDNSPQRTQRGAEDLEIINIVLCRG